MWQCVLRDHRAGSGFLAGFGSSTFDALVFKVNKLCLLLPMISQWQLDFLSDFHVNDVAEFCFG